MPLPAAAFHRFVVAFALPVALGVGACAGAAGPSGTGIAEATRSPSLASPAAGSPASASPISSSGGGVPSLTPVPDGQTVEPGPEQTRLGTVETDWGTIVDGLPAEFPIFPGAVIADVPGELLSGSFEAPNAADEVATWYRDTLTERGYGVELSDPFEDGGRVLDAQADIPECRIQLSFEPQGESTIITVLLASACAGGVGG